MASGDRAGLQHCMRLLHAMHSHISHGCRRWACTHRPEFMQTCLFFPLLMAVGGLAGRDMKTLTKRRIFQSSPAIRRAHRGSRHVISWKLKIFISAPAMAAGALEKGLGLRLRRRLRRRLSRTRHQNDWPAYPVVIQWDFVPYSPSPAPCAQTLDSGRGPAGIASGWPAALAGSS